MGEAMKPRNRRWDEATDRRLNEIQMALEPMCANQSQTIRFMALVFHSIVHTPELLRQVAGAFQDARCALFVRTLPMREPSCPVVNPQPRVRGMAPAERRRPISERRMA